MSKFVELPREFIQCKKIKATEEDIQNRIVTIYASDETPLERFSYEKWERYTLIVSHDEKAIDLTRVNTGVCLFFENHPDGFFTKSFRLGKVKNSEIVDKKLILKVKINRSPEGDRYLQDVEDEVEPGNSIGFVPTKMQVIEKAEYKIDEEGIRRLVKPMIMKAIKWELHEVSAVDVPANPHTGAWKNEAEKEAALERFNSLEKFSVEIIGDDEEIMANSNPTQAPQEDVEGKHKSQLNALQEAKSKVTLGLNYWKLRCKALELYALKNVLTEDEFKLDFSDDPETDVKKLEGMTSDDAAIELKTIERMLVRASKKTPMERVQNQSDRTLLENNKIDGKPTGETTKGHTKNSNPNGKTDDEFALSLIEDL